MVVCVEPELAPEERVTEEDDDAAIVEDVEEENDNRGEDEECPVPSIVAPRKTVSI